MRKAPAIGASKSKAIAAQRTIMNKSNPNIQELLQCSKDLRKNEVWRSINFDNVLSTDLVAPTQPSAGACHVRCNIPDLETYRATVINGFFASEPTVTPEGVVICSLRQAMEKYPQWVTPHLGSCIEQENPYLNLTVQHFSDGIFIYVPPRTQVSKPVQMLSVIDSDQRLLLHTRNLVVVGEESHLQLIHCDDSTNLTGSFANSLTEIAVGRNARLEHYKLQNLNDKTGLLNHTLVAMEEASELRSVAATLNGGHICNHTEVRMRGEHCDTQAHGIYLMDKEQMVDNYIMVDHKKPNCHSNELYKGILDDSARASFLGHVMVHDGATKTEAYQSNKNILLTNKAFVYTRPFLEIYNDDVKCSHGSTIGQLDEAALFYLQSRGISPHTARTLLLYAFCDEVLQHIAIPTLRDRLVDMVKKRLHGDLTICDDCALHCSTPCNGSEVHFEIDPTRL